MGKSRSRLIDIWSYRKPERLLFFWSLLVIAVGYLLVIVRKTGTAQAPDGEDHSWFVCFAPMERPAIAVAVLIEHGGYGAAAALPVAVELIKKAKNLGLLERAAVQIPMVNDKK